MKRGYLALYRKIQDHPFYKERREFSKYEAWIDMLMEVRHKEEPQRVSLGMKIFTCNYGESLKSLRTWAIKWHWSPTKVKRFFKLLSEMNQIVTKSEAVTTRITILNYSKYDPKCNANKTGAKQERNSNETEAVTDKHDKNEKMLIKEKKIPKKKDPFLTYLKDKILSENLTQYQDKIIEFYKYRMAKPKDSQYKTVKGINGLFRNLKDCFGNGLDISECLEITMENEWQTPKPDYFNNKSKGNDKSWKI